VKRDGLEWVIQKCLLEASMLPMKAYVYIWESLKIPDMMAMFQDSQKAQKFGLGILLQVKSPSLGLSQTICQYLLPTEFY